MTIEQKLDKVIKELEMYRSREENFIMAAPDRDDYKDLPEYKFLDKVSITKWFYEDKEWIVVKIWDTFPEMIDHKWNKLKEIVKSYWILIKDHSEWEITVHINATDLKLIK